MSDYSALTKAELLKQIGALTERLDRYETKAASAVAPAQPRPVPEADALAACVRAFDALPDEPSTVSFSSARVRPARTMERILRSLASRYEVPLVEVRQEPCARAHVGDLSQRELIDQALTSGGFR